MIKNTIIILFSIFFLSCCFKNVKKFSEKKNFEIISPSNLENFKLNDSIKFSIKNVDEKYKIDSINIYYDNKKYTITKPKNIFYWHATNTKMGLNNIEIAIFYDKKSEIHNINLIFKSNITPENLKYKIVRKYPHDQNSYTQGLFWKNGYLYESAGRKGFSKIKKIDLINNKIIKEYNLENDYFAEGIAPIDQKIIQITWQDRTGFIYDIDKLELISKFNYYYNEAWGLTSDSNKLYLSDGSHYIYVIDPQSFTQLDIIEVYDNQKKVEKLNELEYVCGNILANIYGESYIVIIDMLGRVIAKIDFKDLIEERYRNNFDYVLNGIAYNPESKHFYITGKLWDNLYEIEIPDFFKFCSKK